MSCDFQCLPFSVPGVVCHFTPYRGEDGGTLNHCASVPVEKNIGGTLAHFLKSVVYGLRHHFSVPLVFSVPPCELLQHRRHTEKQARGRGR